MEAETEIALEVAGKGASVEAPAVTFNNNSLAKTDSESPENPTDRKNPEHSTESRVHLTHDQIEVRAEDETVLVYESNLASCEPRTLVGVAIGLATTCIDGIAWFLKTTVVEEGEGKGGFNVIGQVGMDTYRSGCAAYKVAQRILLRKQPQNNFFAKSKVWAHLPRANGPSAGCTMATSLLSLAMKKPVRKGLAMTGEITPTGRILSVGSVKEKTLGARRSQVKTVIFPEANRGDFEELPENVKEGLDVHFVDEYQQIFELAFNYDN